MIIINNLLMVILFNSLLFLRVTSFRELGNNLFIDAVLIDFGKNSFSKPFFQTLPAPSDHNVSLDYYFPQLVPFHVFKSFIINYEIYYFDIFIFTVIFNIFS